jgi:hypothetical protein
MSDRLGIKFCAVSIGSSNDDDQIVFTMLLNNSFNTLLTLQVKGTGSCSDKALGLNQQWLGPGTLHTCRNGLALYPISFAEDNDLLTL